MAPTKKDSSDKVEKEAKLNPEQSTALILDYLRKQNRPYSATDISANLKNRVTKAAAAKLLKDMHERNEIEGRAAGKQIVYHAKQDEADETSAENLRTLYDETARLKEATNALKAEEKELRLSLREGASRVSLADLKASVTPLEEQKQRMVARLEVLRGGDLEPVSLEEREAVEAEVKRWQKMAGRRRRIRAELWKTVEENVEKEKWAGTKEALGLEF